MHQTRVSNWILPAASATVTSEEPEPALSVATVYQDPLTRYWATELWDRVGQLVGQGGILHQSWKVDELTNADAFSDAVQAAAKADVLVISARSTAAWPLILHVWIDAWLPRRAGRAGAMVALIGISPQPDAQSDWARAYLQTVARKAGLDFLPRERKLPQESSALAAPASAPPPASPACSLRGSASNRYPSSDLHWGLHE